MAKTLEDRLWHMVDTQGPDDCWVWRGNKGHGGYGRITVTTMGKVQQMATHRLAWELANKKLLGRQVARHSCDNPPCCNPRHIVPGTQLENVQDAITRGRLNPSRGEWNPFAKLTDEKVLALREDRARGMTVSALSKKYGVSPPVVANVYRGNTWKHVGGPLQIDPRSTDQNRKLVAEEELGVVREYQSGATRKAIRGKFNISAGTIINILKRHGVASHSCGHPPGLRADAVLQVRKMYSQQRISMAALAEQFGVSIAAIHRAIRGAYAPAHGIV